MAKIVEQRFPFEYIEGIAPDTGSGTVKLSWDMWEKK